MRSVSVLLAMIALGACGRATVVQEPPTPTPTEHACDAPACQPVDDSFTVPANRTRYSSWSLLSIPLPGGGASPSATPPSERQELRADIVNHASVDARVTPARGANRWSVPSSIAIQLASNTPIQLDRAEGVDCHVAASDQSLLICDVLESDITIAFSSAE
jgi:hypothetical protein